MLDRELALCGARIADAPLERLRTASTRACEQRLDSGADAFHHAQPRHAEQKRRADREQRKQEQRGAVETDATRESLSDGIAERSAGRERQRHGQAP